MSLILKLARVLQKKSQHKLTHQEWARLNVIVDRYGAVVVSKCLNKLQYQKINHPVGYLEKMAQQYIMHNVEPGERSDILADILKETKGKDES